MAALILPALIHCQAARPGCALIRRRHPTVFPYCPRDGRQQVAATGGVRGRDPSMDER